MSKESFRYQEVYNELFQDICSGHWKTGESLPSEKELSARFDTSTITIKRALEMLKTEGLVRRVPGRGTFVNLTKKERNQEDVQSSEGGNMIGLILEHVSSAFGLDMMYDIILRLEKSGFKVCIRFTFGSIEKETEEIRDLLNMHVRGLIVMPCHDSYYNKTILRLILDDFPVVLVDKRMHGIPVSTVCTDGAGAIQQLIRHLKDRGARDAFLMTIDPVGTSSLGDRTEGFYRGLDETGIRNAGELILPKRESNYLSYEPEKQYVDAISHFLETTPEIPSSIVCTEYAIGRALYVAACKKGLRVGEDLRVCCIDENWLSVQGFTLTHMRQDEHTIAEKAVEILLQIIQGTKHEPVNIRVPAIFHQGSST